MNADRTSIVRPAKSCSSPMNCGCVAHRYQLRPPWKPVRAYSSLYTFSSSSVSHWHAAISSADGISGATVSAIPLSRSMM